MNTPKTEDNKSADDSEMTDDDSVESSEKKRIGRRLLDAIIPHKSNQKLNSDRRITNNDRRSAIDRRDNTGHGYKGPTSRFTIDRRLNIKDRREKK
jgi:hypothetical protein